MLLFDEQPIVFDRVLAREIGDRQATVLQQVHYWIEINRKKQNKEVYKDGYYWTYRSIKNWHEEEFDYLSLSTVRRTFEDLITKGYLITGEYNKFGSDRTKWYRVNKEMLKKLYLKKSKAKEEKNHLSILTNANAQNEQMQMLKMNNSDLLKMSEPIQENKKRLYKENIYDSSQSNINNNKDGGEVSRVNEERTNDNTKKVSRRYNTQYFRDSFGYTRVSMNIKKELDKWIKYVVDICLMHPDTKVNIGKIQTTAGNAQEKFIKLREKHIAYILERLKGVSYPTNHRNYMLAVLYNAEDQYESSQSTFKGEQGKHYSPIPDYLQQQIEGIGDIALKKRTTPTVKDEEAYNEMLRELNKGKECKDD
ncbi:hypothetical protein HMPREF1983_00949 [Gemella bergeri ATCC 700627]|uniref:Uncharacterized protein n=1 Tax=Gemella bergeri ATCC 700627 TaxID=1321820 RepID=U2QMW3_9BACL|nr:hypothetical protein [Gemella bergeri]ERK57846.1 hypothetical protein HMPREF1983_00949 [Gemella bergeri ATCC 700627]